MKKVTITKQAKRPKAKENYDNFKCKECGNTDLHWMKIANSIIGPCLNPLCKRNPSGENNAILTTVLDEAGDEYYIPLCQYCKENCKEIEVEENDLVPKIACPQGGGSAYRNWYFEKIKG